MKTNVQVLFVGALAAVSATNAAPSMDGQESHEVMLLKRTFLANTKCYGAPIPPWQKGCQPGWYSGKPCKGLSLPKWDGGDVALCSYFSQIPFLSKFFSNFCQGKHTTSPLPPSCNPPKNGGGPSCTGPNNEYQVVFTNYTTNATSGVYTGQVVGAATRDPPNYLTYGMVDSVTDCFAKCDSVTNCTFINTYHDVLNDPNSDDQTGQHDPAKIKCVLFSACGDPAKLNDNWGGQNDPNFITDSNGYCRSGKCPVK